MQTFTGVLVSSANSSQSYTYVLTKEYGLLRIFSKSVGLMRGSLVVVEGELHAQTIKRAYIESLALPIDWVLHDIAFFHTLLRWVELLAPLGCPVPELWHVIFILYSPEYSDLSDNDLEWAKKILLWCLMRSVGIVPHERVVSVSIWRAMVEQSVQELWHSPLLRVTLNIDTWLHTTIASAMDTHRIQLPLFHIRQ